METWVWIILFSAIGYAISLAYAYCSHLDKTRYMLVFEKQILYFEDFGEIVKSIKSESMFDISSARYQIYVRDKKTYTFVTDNIFD